MAGPGCRGNAVLAGFMVDKVLLIAFHFPPVRVSSGVQRTLAFSQYLEENGWRPIVLTVNQRAYPKVSSDQLKDIPNHLQITRSLAFDASRHLAIKGRYPRLFAIPDRWISWWVPGIFSGLYLILKYRPKIIWSTYPIPTAHLIGLSLSMLSGIPWIADFRDSMIDESYPSGKLMRRIFYFIERLVIKRCRLAVFTTQGTLDMYKKRYRDIPSNRFRLIANGYNESIVKEIESAEQKRVTTAWKKTSELVLVHSGVIYPEERNPAHFLKAIGELKREKEISCDQVQIVLRASGHQQLLSRLLNQHDITDIVKLEPSVDYRAALTEMLHSDGLLILQAASCNHQIPAKIYEYLRIGKPILALTDSKGDTAGLVRKTNSGIVVAIDDSSEIKKGLMEFLSLLKSDHPFDYDPKKINQYSRRKQTGELAAIFSEVISADSE